MEDYKTYIDNKLIEMGLNPEKLTQAQKNLAVQPIEAPENYYKDGEVTHSQAKKMWVSSMLRAGFNQFDVTVISGCLGI